MKIAMLGLKGIPATYGGVERYTEEVATRLASRGHEVIVYCRAHYTPKEVTLQPYKGVTLVRHRTWHTKTTDALSHTYLATRDLIRRRVDVAHYYSLGPGVFAGMPRRAGIPTLLHIHNQEWRGGRWGPIGKAFFRLADAIAVSQPSGLAVISQQFLDYYQARSPRPVGFTSTGIALPPPADAAQDTAYLDALSLQPQRYLLFVGRLVPQKAIHLLLEAYERLAPEMPLIIVGDGDKNAYYAQELRKHASPQIRFLGFRYGSELDALYRGAYAYVLPSKHEGIALTLLEALAHGVCVVASDIPENLEGLDGRGITFESGNTGDLAAKLAYVLANPTWAAQQRALAPSIIERYSWDGVVDRLEAIYDALIHGQPLPSAPAAPVLAEAMIPKSQN
jgi:glycosyltransferase involved in cell wall biosynthesis